MEFKTHDGRSNSLDDHRATEEAEQGKVAEFSPPEFSPSVKKKRRISKPSVKASDSRVKVVVGLIIAAVIIFLGYGYFHSQSELKATKTTAEKSHQQTSSSQVINQVGKLVTLPAGETPTVATVNDAAKLKSQPFFADAKNGDKVLIYSKAGKAVLYRPSTNRIIEYSRVNLGSS
jgi:hypothetical protein